LESKLVEVMLMSDKKEVLYNIDTDYIINKVASTTKTLTIIYYVLVVLLLIIYVADLVPQFLEHCYIKRQQANSYKNVHALVLSNEYPRDLCVIQADFSENYTCAFQDEIQSAHWQQSQVSLFTAAVIILEPFIQ